MEIDAAEHRKGRGKAQKKEEKRGKLNYQIFSVNFSLVYSDFCDAHIEKLVAMVTPDCDI